MPAEPCTVAVAVVDMTVDGADNVVAGPEDAVDL